MAYLWYHHDKEKMIKKSSQNYYSHMRRLRWGFYLSLALNILFIFLGSRGAF